MAAASVSARLSAVVTVGVASGSFCRFWRWGRVRCRSTDADYTVHHRISALVQKLVLYLYTVFIDYFIRIYHMPLKAGRIFDPLTRGQRLILYLCRAVWGRADDICIDFNRPVFVFLRAHNVDGDNAATPRGRDFNRHARVVFKPEVERAIRYCCVHAERCVRNFERVLMALCYL